VNWNFLGLQNLEHADMCEPFGTSAASTTAIRAGLGGGESSLTSEQEQSVNVNKIMNTQRLVTVYLRKSFFLFIITFYPDP